MNELSELMDSPHECGCKGSQGTMQALGTDEPDLATLERQLDEFLVAVPSSEDELAFAGLDAELANVDELDLAALGEEALPSLQSVLHIAEQYPGLKITFSF